MIFSFCVRELIFNYYKNVILSYNIGQCHKLHAIFFRISEQDCKKIAFEIALKNVYIY
jgi:hypothetical protein